MTEHVVDISRSTELVDEEPEPRQIVDGLTNALLLLDCDRSVVSVRIVSAEEMRFLKPNKINQDSTWTFLFMGDRFVDDANYYIGKPFIQKYGEEKASRRIAKAITCFRKNTPIKSTKQLTEIICNTSIVLILLNMCNI